MTSRPRLLVSLIGAVGLSLLFLFSGSASAAATTVEPTFMITQTELQKLSDNLMQLKKTNEASQKELSVLRSELATSKIELTEARKQCSELKTQLAELTAASRNQENSLEAANKSLMKYANEEKRTRLRIKRQRNAWEMVAAGFLVAWAAK